MVGPERCADQAELLTFFDLPISLLQTAAALERVTAELVEDLVADGVRTPRSAGRRASTSSAACRSSTSSRRSRRASPGGRDAGPRTPFIGLIVTAMRSHPPGANVELAGRRRSSGRR